MVVRCVIDLLVVVKRSLNLGGDIVVVVGDLTVVIWFLDGDEIVFRCDLSPLENISFSI